MTARPLLWFLRRFAYVRELEAQHVREERLLLDRGYHRPATGTMSDLVRAVRSTVEHLTPLCVPYRMTADDGDQGQPARILIEFGYTLAGANAVEDKLTSDWIRRNLRALGRREP